MAAARKNTNRKQPGDHTGRKAQELAKEHAEEVAKRQQEIAMINQAEAEEREHEVVDLTGQQDPLSVTRQPGQSGVTTATDADGIMTVTDGGKTYKIKTNDTAVQGVGVESPMHVPGETVGSQRVRDIVDKTELLDPEGDRGVLGAPGPGPGPDVREQGVQIEDTPTEVIRVNADLENVTVGVGTDYTFQEGRSYKVPRHVAQHLEEKGYVWH